MTNKILTPAEALRALADGKKLTLGDLCYDFIHLKNGAIEFNNGAIYDSVLTGFRVYTEPKTKRKIAPYVLTDGKTTWMPDHYFENENEVRACWVNPNTRVVRRVTELEVEVE